jgi:hypothetical protein
MGEYILWHRATLMQAALVCSHAARVRGGTGHLLPRNNPNNPNWRMVSYRGNTPLSDAHPKYFCLLTIISLNVFSRGNQRLPDSASR